MTGLILYIRTILLKDEAISELTKSPKWNIWGHLVTILLGIIYGFISIQQNRDYISSFEAEFLRDIVVPGFFIIAGIIMVFLTRIALTLLLWAASRGFGGPGLLGQIFRLTAGALIPSILAMPGFIADSLDATVPFIAVVGVILGIAWMYFICVRIVLIIQKFVPWKAYTAVLVIFIFFISIYYIVTPPAA
ncbi:YIP1 family protein [Alkalihalobacterium elongatum]|uniref:YIP1 family protein n=1 Tax=Alkalihalobacterium elongatum TaxID=2675466 RepID=UPI001C1FAEA0|nr:YIP1 family protein [Alkalihalobacterium elongatum]